MTDEFSREFGCRLGVGMGVGAAGPQHAEYQQDKSRVSRV